MLNRMGLSRGKRYEIREKWSVAGNMGVGELNYYGISAQNY